MNQARVLILVVGVACLAVGAMLGWVASLQMSHGNGDALAAAEAARADRDAASRAAVQAEGWARVANAAQTLAKGNNDQAQAARQQAQAERQRAQAERQQAQVARQQAHDFAARAEKAAGRAAQPAPRAAAAPKPSGSVGAKPAARPRVAAAAKPHPAPRMAGTIVSDESCRRAAIFERTAAQPSVSREAAYNASVSGIAVNAHCAEPERSVIGAYLLAQRASAEIALKNGDWKSDLAQSDRVLSQCVRHPERYGPLSRGCRQRLTKNVRIRHAATPRTTKPAQQAATEDHLLATPRP